MNSSIETLQAVEEIKKLKAKYCRYLDSENWDGYRSLFADHLRGHAQDGRIIAGADAWVAMVRALHTDNADRTVHHCHMPEITVLDSTRATGIWALFDYVDRVARVDGTRTALFGYGHYEEEYVNTPERGWLIAAIHLTRIRVDYMDASALPTFPPPGTFPTGA